MRDYLARLVKTGSEFMLVNGNEPIARLIATSEMPRPTAERVPDLYPTLWVSEDFDDLLPGEYWLTDQS